MSDTQTRGRRSDVGDVRGGGGERDDRRTDRDERKRSWRADNDDRDGGRDERGFKQMKPGALGMKILVPNSLVGAIIGKGGDEMKKLKEESSCFIRLSQNDKYFPKTNERPCYIEGEPENIVKAIQTIQEKLANDNPRRGPSIDETRKKQCRIVVGANAAGKCIGKGGENVKRLKSEFNVWVKVMGRDDSIPGLDERTVTVSGDSDNTLKAVKDILEMSLGLNNGGTDKNLDYDSFMGGVNSGVPGNNFTQGGFNQAGAGYNSSQGSFNNQGAGFNSQMGGNMGGRTGNMGPPGGNIGGRSGSQGPTSNMGGPGFNSMGGPGPNSMAPGPNNLGPGPNSMGGTGPNIAGNYNNPGAPAQQGINSNQESQQFGQPGQFQGNIQQYPNNNNIPIQQYPGNNGSQNTGSGYGNNPGGGYNNPNQGGAGGYNQGGQGLNQGGQGGYNQASGGYNQTQGYSAQQPPYQGGNQGYQGGNQGGGGGGYQGGNQRGGFQTGSTAGTYQSGGNQTGRGGRGGFNNRGARGATTNNYRGRGAAPRGGRGSPRS